MRRIALLIALSALQSGCGTSTATRAWSTFPTGAKTTSQPAAKSTEPEARLPESAIAVGESRSIGSATILEFQCKQDGRLFLFDQTTKTTLLVWPMRAGQTFEFNMRTSLATVDRKTVAELALLNREEECNLYFQSR